MTRAATSSSSESYQGDALDCQGEKQLRARALPESSDDGLGMIPMKRKRLRKNEHETISDCVPDAEDPDLVDFEDPQPSMCCSSVLGCMDKFGEKVDKCGEEMEHRVEGLDGSEQNVKDGARCDEHQSGLAFVSSKSSKNEGLGLKRKSRRNLAESRTESTLLQQIMENQGRVLGKLKDNSTTSSTTSSINEHDLSDSEVSIMCYNPKYSWMKDMIADSIRFQAIDRFGCWLACKPYSPYYQQLFSLQICHPTCFLIHEMGAFN